MEKIDIREGKKYWIIRIDADEVFSRVSNETNYREHVMASGGPKYILLEEDRKLFDRLFVGAIGNLWLKLGRMSKNITQGIRYSESGAVFRLAVSENHEDNMLTTLGNFINDFLTAYILRDWYERNNIPDEMVKCEGSIVIALNNIISVVHYRKKAVKRPIDPVF